MLALLSIRRGVARVWAGSVPPCPGPARADGYRAKQFNAVVETNTPAIRLGRSSGFQILAAAIEM
jgi:hypothetical protein